jgi:hypothetical protein
MAGYATQPAASPEALAPPDETQPTHEQIASLAYTLWQQRNCPDGSPEKDCSERNKN